MSSVVAELSDDRFMTSRVIVFEPVTDTIFFASCSSAATQFWPSWSSKQQRQREHEEPANRKENGVSMPGRLREL